MVQNAVAGLVRYALAAELIKEEDAVYSANLLLEALRIDALEQDAEESILSFDPEGKDLTGELPQILDELCDYAVETGLIPDDSVTYRDLFDTKLMGILTARPSEVTARFREILSKEGQSCH